MKRSFTKMLLCAGLLGAFTSHAENYWKQADESAAPKNLQFMHPSKFLVYTMNEAALKQQMWNLSANPDEGIKISLPLPDGTSRDFIVWQTPIMPEALAGKYPD